MCDAGSAALARRSVLQVDPAKIDVCRERMRYNDFDIILLRFMPRVIPGLASAAAAAAAPPTLVCSLAHAARYSVLIAAPSALLSRNGGCRHDGYFDLMAGTAGELQWVVDLAVLADGIQTLRRHGWPPSWILMYDVGVHESDGAGAWWWWCRWVGR